LHVRGQLYWDPDTDEDALLAEFAPKFYGPAAKPMAAYWGAIHEAWANTIVTEHEPQREAVTEAAAVHAAGLRGARRLHGDGAGGRDRGRLPGRGGRGRARAGGAEEAGRAEPDVHDPGHRGGGGDGQERAGVVAGGGAAVPRAAGLHRRDE